MVKKLIEDSGYMSLEELFTQRNHLKEIYYDFISESTINRAIKRINKVIENALERKGVKNGEIL